MTGRADPAAAMPRRLRAWPLALGLAVLAALWLGPLPGMARRAFSPHMILHLGVMALAAPLLAAGLLRLVPRQRTAPVAAVLAASALDLVVVWGWHAPLMHEAAAGSDPVFVLQQASFLLAGLALWTACLSGTDRAGRAAGALGLWATVVHMAMLGVLLTVAPRLLYAPQFCLGAFGLDPLSDQMFGGALMASAGVLPFILGGAWLVFQAVRSPTSW